MTIQSNTINITYKDTTRPITFVWNTYYNKQSSYIVVATILHSFKDLIPDYQKYKNATICFNVWKDSEGTLTLPNLTRKFNIQTIGHGELQIELDNPGCQTFYILNRIKFKIQEKLGIPAGCIDLCNEEGKPLEYMETYDSNKNTLFAVFTSYEAIVLEQGYEILDYKSKFKQGRLMRMIFVNVIGNYEIVKFQAEINTITKRTPKMITLDDERNSKRKITTNNIFKIGEYCRHGGSGVLVAWDENVRYGKEYAIRF